MSTDTALSAGQVDRLVRLVEWSDRPFLCIAANRPSISDLRALSRDCADGWPLSMLMAISDCGIDLNRRSDAIIDFVVVETDAMVDLQYTITDAGRRVGRIGENDDGTFRAIMKLRVSDFV